MAHTNESTPSSNAQESTNKESLTYQAEYQENLRLLIRSVQIKEVFSFVIIQHNHPQIIDEVKTLLKKKFPDRSQITIHSANESYHTLTDQIYQAQGFVIIDDFFDMATNPDIAPGFNQRRDRITKLPIQLLAFVPSGGWIMKTISNWISDFWSVRNMVVELEVENSEFENIEINFYQLKTLSKNEFDKINEEVNNTIKEIENYKYDSDYLEIVDNLYEEITNKLLDIRKREHALKLTEERLKFVKENRFELTQIIQIKYKKALILFILKRYSESIQILRQNIKQLVEKVKGSLILLVDHYILISQGFIETANLSATKKYSKKSLGISQRMGYTNGFYNSLLIIGYIFSVENQHESAVESFEIVLKNQNNTIQTTQIFYYMMKIKFSVKKETFQLYYSDFYQQLNQGS